MTLDRGPVSATDTGPRQIGKRYLMGMRMAVVTGCMAVACAGLVPASASASASTSTLRSATSVQNGRIQVALATAAGTETAGFETVAAARGGRPLDVAETGEVAGAGLVTIERAGLTETVRTDAGGAEQSWTFAHAPGTSGDLTLAVQPSNLDYLGADAAGLRLGKAGLDVSYSVGTWVDARGRQWTVPVTYVDGRIQLTVSDQILGSSAFPAVLDPQIIVTPITQ